MAKFIQRPILIEAVRMPDAGGVIDTTSEWMQTAVRRGEVWFSDYGEFRVRSFHGVTTGIVGDYVVRGPTGDIRVARRAEFEECHEEVE